MTQFNTEVSIYHPELLSLLLKKHFWRKYKSILIKTMFPGTLEKLFVSIANFHEKFEEDLDRKKLWEVIKIDWPTLTEAQKVDLYELVDSIKEAVEYSEAFAEKVLTAVWKQEVFRQVVEVGVKGSEGQITTLEPLFDIYNKHSERFIPTDSFKECAMDVDDLMEADSTQAKWKFSLQPLAERIGGMSGGHFLEIAARPDCYAPDVEVLTREGWCRFEDYKGQEIAQINFDRSMSFVKPLLNITREHSGHLIAFTDKRGRISISVTPAHDMIVYDRGGKFYRQPALLYEDAPRNHLFHTATQQINRRNAATTLSPVERLLIAFQADGAMPKKENTGTVCGARTVRFSFKKDRKKQRLEAIIKACGFEYYLSNDKRDSQGYRTYYVKWPLSCSLQPNKDFTWVDFSHKSQVWCQDFIEELSYWDATRRTDTRYKYDTTSGPNANLVQIVAIKAGYNVKYAVMPDTRKAVFSDIYSLTIRTEYKPLSLRTVQSKLVDYTGKVYCVNVPSGILLVRSNGQTLICGNCGKTAFLTTLVCAPGGWADQGAIVDWYGNEEAIRRTRWRCISAWTGKTKEELKKDVQAAKAAWAVISSRVRTFDVPYGTPIETVVARTKTRKPHIVIVDQLDKMSVSAPHNGGFSNEQDRTRLLRIKYRDVGKQTDSLMVAVGQASAAAENERIVTYDMCENSKTGKAAECDVFVGIGRTKLAEGMLEENYMRWVTISKNKLDTPWKGVIPCRLIPEISRYDV